MGVTGQDAARLLPRPSQVEGVEDVVEESGVARLRAQTLAWRRE